MATDAQGAPGNLERLNLTFVHVVGGKSANRYYYRKERDGSRVKSTYVGRGQMTHMIAGFESNSAEREKRAKKSIENQELERVEMAIDRVVDLVQLFADSSVIVNPFDLSRM
ncbi:MAG: hypothetical protein LC794_02775 [Acidobacteria bacterium]|nr:hypothetical protein [Acidobacteriota bacterium]